MSKISTKIKGTTYYNIDFSKIKPGDKLSLVRDPQNIYDSNAIKVLHNDMMLGHIDKKIAIVLAGIIDNGAKVKAIILKILGLSQQNYGILINIAVYESRDKNYYNRGENSPYVQDVNRFEVRDTSCKLDISYQTINYDKILYYKQKYNLEDELPIEAKPDFKAIYKSSHGLLDRIFGDGEDKFVRNETINWNKKVEKTIEHNNNIKIKKLDYDKVFDNNDFILFKKLYFIKFIFNKLEISVRDSKSIDKDIENGYVTTYELVLYEKLRGKVWMCRQVIIKGYSLDFLLFNLESNKIWAVEVDGGIHRMLHKFNKDNECAEELNKQGISLIRVSNSLISSNVDEVVQKILSTINTM